MPAHADNAEPHGSANTAPFRDFASVVYFNDEYRGGELCFTKVGRRIVPKKALLMAFKGGIEHMHGVSEVEGGSRYTMPGWYTRDITPGSIRVGRTVRLTLAPLTASLGGPTDAW